MAIYFSTAFLHDGNTSFLFLCKQLNLDRLLARMWDEMGLVRVYTKPQGQQPDFGDPVVLSAVCCIMIIVIMNTSAPYSI
jgi:ribosome-interacting GTPase 1